MKKAVLAITAVLFFCSWNLHAEMSDEVQVPVEEAFSACDIMGSYLGGDLRSPILPAYDDSDVCNEKVFDYGKTSPLKITDKRVEILIAVNMDDYPGALCRDIKKIIELSDKYWLHPKTNLSFAITGILYGRLGKYDADKDNSRYGKINIYDKFISDYLREHPDKIPDYVVYFLGDEISVMHGGHAGGVYLQPEVGGVAVIPGGRIDLTHIYGQCGYDDAGKNIISNVSIGGECKNKPGTPCVKKNGVQICVTMARSFMTSDIFIMQAITVVHELMHVFGGARTHFDDPNCAQVMGEEYDSVMAKPIDGPFDSRFQEYAGICPYVFEKLRTTYGVDQ